jgi:biotin carboxyl carrier protein
VEQTIRAEMVASIHSVVVAVGDEVGPGDTVVILESMKMEIPVVLEVGGTVADIAVAAGDAVSEGDVLVILS